MSIKLTHLRDDHGVAVGVIGAMTLVEELVEARARAEAKEQRQRALVDGMLDPFVLMTAVRDEQGQIIDFFFEDANPAALAAYKRTRDELVGHRLEEIQPQSKQTDLYAMYVECIEQGTPIILDDWFDANAHGAERAPRYDVRGVKVGDSVSETWRNVTERNEAIERIVESEERFRLLAQSSSGIVLQARDGIINWISPSLTQELGWPTADWIGRRFEDFVHADDATTVQEQQRVVETGVTRVGRLRVRASLGAYHWIEMHAGPFTNARGEQDGLVGSFRVIDSEVEAQERLERQARFDDLTGALKRDLALARLNDVARSPRSPGSETGVLFIDLDDFKVVNDTWGHVAGDVVLKAMSDRVRATIRTADTVARIGGDEFLVLLDGMHDLSEVFAVAEKIRSRCAEPVATSEGAVSTTVSIGATLTHPVETGDAIIARADRAMYEAKKRGRNLVIPIDAIN
jgi:diguanylate cyclase (GGDEF)-like protein/PAS domain S-box-containing protein